MNTPAPVKPIHAKPQLYALMFASLKGIARSFGYNLILDGSMSRDLDLIAIPWSDKPMDEFEMVQAFDRELTGRHKDSKEKYLFSIIANSRHKYVIDIDRGGYYRNTEGHIADPPQFRQDPQWYIDISVIPDQAALREENAKLKEQLEKRSRSKINPYDTYAVAKELEKTKKYRKS